MAIKKKIKAFTDDEIKLLQRLLDDLKTRRMGSPPQDHDSLWDGGDQPSPEVYVAKPTSGTIPGMVVAVGWTGTGTGTGTAPECDQYDSPGRADCRIYEIISTVSCGPALMQVEGFEQSVYNVGEAAITPGDAYVPILRDKFGRWIAQAVPPGGCVIVGFCCGAFAAGNTVRATVTWTTDAAAANIGATIQVSDPCKEYNNTSGSGCGAAVKVGASWYMIRLTCPAFVASCGETGTGTGPL